MFDYPRNNFGAAQKPVMPKVSIFSKRAINIGFGPKGLNIVFLEQTLFKKFKSLVK